MCTKCFSAGDLVAQFNQFRGESYECGSCAVVRNTQCLPRAIVHGQTPQRVFFGPRLEGIGAFKLFDVAPTEAFSSASVDGVIAAYGSGLARLTWMPELATALSTKSIKEIVYVGQTGGPAAEHLADPETARNPLLGVWYNYHRPVIALAQSLFGEASDKDDLREKIERALPVYAKQQLEEFVRHEAPNIRLTVKAGLYDARSHILSWVEDSASGAYGLPEIVRGTSPRKVGVAHEGARRAYIGCMDSRAIPSHVFKIPPTDAFVSTSMGGIWAPYNSPLARLTWMPEMVMALERTHVDEFVFLGHTGCAGAKLVSEAPVSDALRADWQAYYHAALLPHTEALFGDQDTQPALQAAIEKTIPVYMQQQIQNFLEENYPDSGMQAHSYLYGMREGNLYRLCDEKSGGEYEMLTNHAPRDFTALPKVCPQTKMAFSCR